MTAADWDACPPTKDPRPLVDHVWPAASPRKRRLFLIALHLRGGYQPSCPWERHAVRLAERAAEGAAGEDDLRREWAEGLRRVTDAAPGEGRRVMATTVLVEPTLGPSVFSWTSVGTPDRGSDDPTGRRPKPVWAARTHALLRCLFGHPFRPVAFDLDWKTSAAVELARGIDADRAYHLLPILADALEDAGCGEPAVLDHCRRDPDHARGCWVVDGVLGRA